MKVIKVEIRRRMLFFSIFGLLLFGSVIGEYKAYPDAHKAFATNTSKFIIGKARNLLVNTHGGAIFYVNDLRFHSTVNEIRNLEDGDSVRIFYFNQHNGNNILRLEVKKK